MDRNMTRTFDKTSFKTCVYIVAPNLGGSELKVPQFWEATSVGGFPDLRKVARI
jgi:hypothetical protein